MPYKKRTYTKKRRAPRRVNYTRKVARQEARKVVAKQIETKMFDGGINSTAIDWTGSISLWNMTYDPVSASNILQGVADNQYIGQAIKPTFLTIRGGMTIGDSTNAVRVILLQDKVSGVALTAANILETTGNVRAPFSPLEREYDNTFKVIMDRLYRFDTDDGYHTFKFKIPGRHLRRITFRGSTGSIESGGLYLLMISDSGAASHPTTVFTWRLSYKDA